MLDALTPADELARLYREENLTTRTLADRFGVDQTTVWRALHDPASRPAAGAAGPGRSGPT